MKEKCGGCEGYRPIDGSGVGWCESWKQSFGFQIPIDSDSAPLENLRVQNRLAYLPIRALKWLIGLTCFRPKEKNIKSAF